jgi:DNA transformation protein and related proteins
MAVSAQFLQFAIDLLSQVQAVESRRMFGGAGFYAGQHFFAIADDDTLYFKVDAATRPRYEAEGMRAFQPMGPDSAPMRGYYQLPPRLYEDVDELREWMRAAIAVAAHAAAAAVAAKSPRRKTARRKTSAASRRRPKTSRGR